MGRTSDRQPARCPFLLLHVQGVQKLVDAGGLSMAGNGVDDIFKMAVLTTKFELGELYNGQTLTAMNGQTLTVKVTK